MSHLFPGAFARSILDLMFTPLSFSLLTNKFPKFVLPIWLFLLNSGVAYLFCFNHLYHDCTSCNWTRIKDYTTVRIYINWHSLEVYQVITICACTKNWERIRSLVVRWTPFILALGNLQANFQLFSYLWKLYIYIYIYFVIIFWEIWFRLAVRACLLIGKPMQLKVGKLWKEN